MTTNYDPRAYAYLLVEAIQGVIRNEKENERALAFVERLMKKGVPTDHRPPTTDPARRLAIRFRLPVDIFI